MRDILHQNASCVSESEVTCQPEEEYCQGYLARSSESTCQIFHSAGRWVAALFHPAGRKVTKKERFVDSKGLTGFEHLKTPQKQIGFSTFDIKLEKPR